MINYPLVHRLHSNIRPSTAYFLPSTAVSIYYMGDCLLLGVWEANDLFNSDIKIMSKGTMQISTPAMLLEGIPEPTHLFDAKLINVSLLSVNYWHWVPVWVTRASV